MTIHRIAIAVSLACALAGCASYDAGYRRGYADAHPRIAIDAGEDVPDFADFDAARNGYYDGYGYPYEVAGYGNPWQFGFAAGPWFYSPWYGYGYPYAWYGGYGWYRPWHGHHHHHHGPDSDPHHHSLGVAARAMRVQDTGTPSAIGNPAGSSIHQHDEVGQPTSGFQPRIPMYQRGSNSEPREPSRPAPRHSHR